MVESHRFVEWFAGRIDDPVIRLRFLKAVAPRSLRRSRRPRSARYLLPPVILAASLSFFLVRAAVRVEPLPVRLHPPRAPLSLQVQGVADVWQVDQGADSETYSNGLRIDNSFAVLNHPRSYAVYPAEHPEQAGERRFEPAGIVFHTTESHQAPFQAKQNNALKRIGESLLEYVRRRRAYNFLIDRFGRVYRIVAESDAAQHAGYSVWADGKWLYVNLNESFLGVSLEAETRPGQVDAAISPAQVRAASMLTEMLRSRYGIPAANCVTHAQVSVNPLNMRVGYHTDWASSFPFEEVGLPDNYLQPLPAVWAFGFEFDASFQQQAGSRIYIAAQRGEQALRERAAAAGAAPAAYRKALQRRFRERFGEVRRHPADEADAPE